jgi:2-dehydropantoate 2-reductase
MKTIDSPIPPLKIAVVGAGALGLYYGAMLQRGGQEVHFLLRRDYDAIRQGGLSVKSINGDFHLPKVLAYRNSAEIGPVNLVLIGLKTFANHQLVELVKPLVAADTMLLSLQNGLGNEELLAENFGAGKVLGGIAFLCSNRGEPGSVHHLGEGRIRLGEFAAGLTRRATLLAEVFSAAGVPCQAVEDLLRARWEKLVWNIPFNGLCALTGKDVTELLRHAPSFTVTREIMREVVSAANAQGLSKPLAEEFVERMLEMTLRMDHYRPSMMIDRQEGRPLELAAIYAIPLEQARRQQVAVPRIAMLHGLLELGEKDR